MGLITAARGGAADAVGPFGRRLQDTILADLGMVGAATSVKSSFGIIRQNPTSGHVGPNFKEGHIAQLLSHMRVQVNLAHLGGELSGQGWSEARKFIVVRVQEAICWVLGSQSFECFNELTVPGSPSMISQWAGCLADENANYGNATFRVALQAQNQLDMDKILTRINKARSDAVGNLHLKHMKPILPSGPLGPPLTYRSYEI